MEVFPEPILEASPNDVVITYSVHNGQFERRVQTRDGSYRLATEAEIAASENRNRIVNNRKRMAMLQIEERVISDPDWRTNLTPCYLEYVAWKKGLLPDYSPSWSQLRMLALEDVRTTKNKVGVHSEETQSSPAGEGRGAESRAENRK